MTGAISDTELSAWLDGETPAERRVAIDAYLARDPAQAARVDTWRRQNEIIRARFSRVAAEPIPLAVLAALHVEGRHDVAQRIAAVLPAISDEQPDAPIRHVERFERARHVRRMRLAFVTSGSFLAGAVAACIAALTVGHVPTFLTDGRIIAGHPIEATLIADPLETLASRAREAHRIFILDAARPVEVHAGDPQLAIWLSRRVSLTITPPSLAEEGLSLLGGRVAPSETGPAGLLVYENSSSARFGLFITRAPSNFETRPRLVSGRSLAAVAWTSHGAAYAVTGRDVTRLLRVAAAVQKLNIAKQPTLSDDH